MRIRNKALLLCGVLAACQDLPRVLAEETLAAALEGKHLFPFLEGVDILYVFGAIIVMGLLLIGLVLLRARVKQMTEPDGRSAEK